MAWQAIAAQLVVRGSLWLLNKAWANGEKKAPKPRPEAIDFPLTQVGAPVPIVYGTVRIDSPVLIWAARESADLDSLNNRLRYRIDMLFALGVPPSTILGDVEPPTALRFFYGDVEAELGAFGSGLVHASTTDINGALADDSKFCAIIEFFDGRSDQLITNYPTALADLEIDYHMRTLAGVDGGTIPGYRHQMLLAVLATVGRITAGRIGLDPQVKQIGVEVRARGYSPMTTGFYDANPAWVLYDLICGEVYKLGYPQDYVDLSSFEAVSEILAEEEHGCSVSITSLSEVRNVIAGLLDQIDGVLYEDASGGDAPILKLRLIRAVGPDDVDDVLDEDNMLGGNLAPRMQVVGWAGAANQIDVSFTDRSRDYKQNVATAERLANAIGQDGRPRPRTVDFPFCMNSILASKLAARELSVASRPLLAMTAYVNRTMFHLVPGDVVIVDRPDLNLNEKAFRVVDVDLGQLAAPQIKLELVEDVFGNLLGANPGVDPIVQFLLPVHERLLTEAPPWIQKRLYDAGILTATSSDPLAYAFAAAANTDDAIANSFSTRGTDLFNPLLLSSDKPASTEWQTHATVKTAYPRTADPYDTATGLELDNVSTQFASYLTLLGSFVHPETDVAQGVTLAVLYSPDTQEHEFISFESSETITGGWKLTRVWRGLLDTPPRDWPVGTRLVFISYGYPGMVGRTPRFEDAVVREQFVPAGGVLSGSGDDPIDTVTIQARSAMPQPVADFTINGRDLQGTLGQPPVSSTSYKAVTLFDGAGDVFANKRNRLEPNIVRGDTTGALPEAGEVYDVVAQLADGSESEVAILTGLTSNPSTIGEQALLLGKVGHGAIDVKLRTRNTVTGFSSFRDPTIRVNAPTWRNLLANSHAIESLNTNPTVEQWTNVVGTVQSTQGTSSPSRSSTGCYFTSATASAGVTEFQQTVDVRGYKPAGLRAYYDFYYRNFSSDGNDTVSVYLEALASDGTTVLDSTSYPGLAGLTALWTRAEDSLLIPEGTCYLRMTVTLTAVGGGDTVPSTAFAEPSLRLGQATEQLLVNPTFDVEPIVYTLDVNVDASPEPVEANETMSVQVDIGVGGGTQSGLVLEMLIQHSVPYEVGWTAPTNADLDGWTMSVAWALDNGNYTATFTRSSLGVGAPISTLQFTVNAKGVGTVETEAVLTSSEYVGSATDMDTVDVEEVETFPTYIGAGTAASGSGDLTPGMPTHQADDILVLAVADTFTTTTDPSTPSGWTKISTGQNSGAFSGIRAHLTLFYKRAASGAESAPTSTDNGEFRVARVYCFRGCTTSGSPVDVSTSNGDNDGDGSISIGGTTTTVGNALVAIFTGAFVQATGASITSVTNSNLANLTERDDTAYALGEDIHLAMATGELASAGAIGTTTASWSGQGVYAISSHFVIALKP